MSCLPTMTFPVRPAAAWPRVMPAPPKADSPSAACQPARPAEVTTTGRLDGPAVTAPTASQPGRPCTTLASVPRPGRARAAELTRRQRVAPEADQMAGYPFALPTATRVRPATAMPLTRSAGPDAPAMAGKFTALDWRPARTRYGRWPSAACAVAPAATTVRSAVTVTPASVCAELPNPATRRQARPLVLTHATLAPPASCPDTTAPWSLPPTAVILSWFFFAAVIVATRVQRAPLRDA